LVLVLKFLPPPPPPPPHHPSTHRPCCPSLPFSHPMHNFLPSLRNLIRFSALYGPMPDSERSLASGKAIFKFRLDSQEAAGTSARKSSLRTCCKIFHDVVNALYFLSGAASAPALLSALQDMGPLPTSLPPKKFFGRFARAHCIRTAEL
jgi:hypothetical protein